MHARREWVTDVLCDRQFFRYYTIYDHLRRARERLAPMLNVLSETIALIPNATSGSNTVLRDYRWQEGDIILALSTVYDAVVKTVEYIQDTHPTPPELRVIDVTYPIKHDDLVKLVESKLDEIEKKGELKRVKFGWMDSISSLPGVRVPWERLCKLYRQRGILTFVSCRSYSVAAPEMVC